MNRLNPSEINSFLRQFRFPGGRLRRMKLHYGSGDDFRIEIAILAKTALKDLGSTPKPVRLRLELIGVEEFRFQKRPNSAEGKLHDLRIGYFNGLFFLTLDDMGLSPGDMPKLHDYRAGDHYLATRQISWEVVERPKKA
ncbi:MAG: hypothetical protein ACRC8S_10770 [Fimbriiglobus sp.]|jgi:hypothetical protein